MITIAKNIVSRIVNAFSATRISECSYGSQMYDLFSMGGGSAGVRVSEHTAMSISAVYACVDLIGGCFASLPLHFYRRTDAGRERYTPELWWMLNERPWGQWSAAAMWQYAVRSRLLNGDAFIEIHRASPYSPNIIGFEPIHPTSVIVNCADGRLVYTLNRNGKVKTIESDDILHITGVGFDGIRSVSQIQYVLRNAAGIALAADEHSASFFANGARPDYAIEVPGNLSAEQQEMFRNSWSNRHQGVQKSHLPALLTGGSKIHEITMNSEDSQLLTTRGFQVQDIARIFGVPTHMIGHVEKTSSWGTGIEQMSIGFVKFTLQRHLVAFEQEINSKIFKTSRNFCEFQTSGLERGDIKSRNESYRIALGRAGEPGWMTVNEVRTLENMPPIDGADVLNTGTPQDPSETPLDTTQD